MDIKLKKIFKIKPIKIDIDNSYEIINKPKKRDLKEYILKPKVELPNKSLLKTKVESPNKPLVNIQHGSFIIHL